MGQSLGVRALATILALASIPTAGCSWLFVNKPPEPPTPASPPIECTASVAAPLIDTLAAALLAGAGVAGFIYGAQPDQCSGGCWFTLKSEAMAGAAVALASAVPLAISAGYGFSKTSDCRLLKEAQLACVSGVEASCAALRGKPAGEDCTADIECGGGNTCFRGTCNPKPR
jgi:hypothetical protein